MRNQKEWRTSKFCKYRGKFRASRDPNEVSVSSRLIADSIVEYFSRYIPKYCRGNLLDLGCGNAPLYEVYKSYADNIVCIDWINSLHNLKYIDIACDLSKPLPLASHQFDSIILSDVLEHIPEPEVLWQEMSRIIRPNGKLFISVPFFYWIHEQPHDYYRYTEYALKRFADKSGFDVLIIEQYGGALEIIADIASKKVINCHWRLGPIISDNIQRIVSWYISRISVGQKKTTSFPFGYFLVLSKVQ